MLTDKQCQGFRPLGSRLLVQRYSLQEQSIGGVIVLGRDFPTMGRIYDIGKSPFTEEFKLWDEVQWSIKPDFDQRCVIGPDWLCLEADDINVRIDNRGVARAVGNRVLLSPQEPIGLLAHVSPIISNEFHLTRWALGRVESRGFKAIDSLGHLDSLSVIYNPSFRSELRLNGQQYFVVRDEDCIATVED